MNMPRSHRVAQFPAPAGSAEPAAQVVVLVPERAGQMAAEGAEVLADERGLPLPSLGVDGEQEVEVVLIDVQSIGIKGIPCRDLADRADGCLGVAGEPFDDPLQDTAVLAEARPQEPAGVILSEPVDEVDARQFGGAPPTADIEPVGEVVTHVVAAKWQHGKGVTAQLPDAPVGWRRPLRWCYRAAGKPARPRA